jgi:hypothetical protein
MTNPNPSPELLPCPRCGSTAFVTTNFGVWCQQDRCLTLPPRGNRAEAITAWNTRATLSQTPPAPSLPTDVQSAATGVHEHDVSLKVAMPAPGEVDYAEAARVMFEACRQPINRVEQCYPMVDALAQAGFLATVAAGDDEGVALDWRAVAKLAGEHGVRYRTNTALEQFLAGIATLPTTRKGDPS